MCDIPIGYDVQDLGKNKLLGVDGRYCQEKVGGD